MDIPRPATETAPVSQYEIRATADIEPGLAVDVAELRRLTGGDVEVLSPGVITVLVVAEADDPYRLARSVTAPMRELSRCGIWTVRRRGMLPVRRRVTGAWMGLGRGDDGLGGVREPRRPMPSAGSSSVALEPPAT